MQLIKPVPPDCTVTLGFGRYPFNLQNKFGLTFHNGIDLALPKYLPDRNIPATAAAEGIVLRTGFDPQAGKYVLISHNDPTGMFITSYLHLNCFTVTRNQHVLAKENIGFMGNTGYSTGKHLHLGLVQLYIYQLKVLNPTLYMRSEIGK